MKKEKIIAVTMTCPFPTNYGGKIGTLSNLRMLSSKFDVFLCGICEDGDVINDEGLSKVCTSYRFFPMGKKLTLKNIPLFHPWAFKIRTNKQLIKYIDSLITDNDIKYIFIDSLFLLDDVKHFADRCKIIVHEQNLEFEALKEIGKTRGKLMRLVFDYQSILTKKIELNIFKKYGIKGMTFVSFDEKNKFCELSKTPSDLTFYLPVVYEAKEKTSSTPIELDILMVANYGYSPNKNALHWFLDNCLEKIAAKLPQVKFLVVGRGLDFESISKINEHPNAVAVGEVDDVGPYYMGAKSVVIPLLHGAGVKIKLLEAVSYGRPIICTPKTIEGTRFNSNCVNLASDDLTFAESVLKVLSNPDESHKMSELAKDIFKNDYDGDNVSTKLHDFIISL